MASHSKQFLSDTKRVTWHVTKDVEPQKQISKHDLSKLNNHKTEVTTQHEEIQTDRQTDRDNQRLDRGREENTRDRDRDNARLMLVENLVHRQLVRTRHSIEWRSRRRPHGLLHPWSLFIHGEGGRGQYMERERAITLKTWRERQSLFRHGESVCVCVCVCECVYVCVCVCETFYVCDTIKEYDRPTYAIMPWSWSGTFPDPNVTKTTPYRYQYIQDSNRSDQIQSFW
jgi:hypothetical protein